MSSDLLDLTIKKYYILSLVPPEAGKIINVTAVEGTDALFNIKLTAGKPKPLVKWFISEEEIIILNIGQYIVTEEDESFTLTIKSVNILNSGSYYAQLINEAGTVSSNKATLTINSK